MALKYVLLTMLNRQAQTGYEIVKTFESAVGYFWSASHQQVYRELSKLSENRLVKFVSVKQGDKPNKKIYRLTASGKRELLEWLQKPVAETPTKDLLLVKLLNINQSTIAAIQVEFDLTAAQAQQRLELYKSIELNHYSRASRAALPLEDLALYLALRKGIVSIESHIDWLNEARTAMLQSKDLFGVTI